MAEEKVSSVETTVREIRRKTRKKYNAEEKMRIVLEGLRGETSIAELCRREGLHPNLYYKWSKEFIEAGKQRLVGDIHREADRREVNERTTQAVGGGTVAQESRAYTYPGGWCQGKKLAGQGHLMGGLTVPAANISMRHSQAEK